MFENAKEIHLEDLSGAYIADSIAKMFGRGAKAKIMDEYIISDDHAKSFERDEFMKYEEVSMAVGGVWNGKKGIATFEIYSGLTNGDDEVLLGIHIYGPIPGQ